MRTLLRRFRNRYGFVAGCFLWSLLATLFVPITASAEDRENSTSELADSGQLPPSSLQSPVDQSGGTPHWTVSAEAIVLGRTGGANQTLVSRVPGDVPFYAPAPYLDTATAPGTEAFSGNQFHQGVSAGPKIGLIYHGDSGYGVQLSYFNIFDQSATKAIGPDSPSDWLVMKAPGSFWQTQDFRYQAMAWTSNTDLFSAEANGRLDLSSRMTVLAGFRWFQLNDTLVGTLTPADRTSPIWKDCCYSDDIFLITPGGPAGYYPPFWTTSTTNNLLWRSNRR